VCSSDLWHYADKYITKPYDPGELLNSIRASLEYYSTGFSGT
jgi:DNA-binding response OmpR family regulator